MVTNDNKSHFLLLLLFCGEAGVRGRRKKVKSLIKYHKSTLMSESAFDAGVPIRLPYNVVLTPGKPLKLSPDAAPFVVYINMVQRVERGASGDASLTLSAKGSQSKKVATWTLATLGGKNSQANIRARVMVGHPAQPCSMCTPAEPVEYYELNATSSALHLWGEQETYLTQQQMRALCS